jgi:hypothetical protein
LGIGECRLADTGGGCLGFLGKDEGGFAAGDAEGAATEAGEFDLDMGLAGGFLAAPLLVEALGQLADHFRVFVHQVEAHAQDVALFPLPVPVGAFRVTGCRIARGSEEDVADLFDLHALPQQRATATQQRIVEGAAAVVQRFKLGVDIDRAGVLSGTGRARFWWRLFPCQQRLPGAVYIGPLVDIRNIVAGVVRADDAALPRIAVLGVQRSRQAQQGGAMVGAGSPAKEAASRFMADSARVKWSSVAGSFRRHTACRP